MISVAFQTKGLVLSSLQWLHNLGFDSCGPIHRTIEIMFMRVILCRLHLDCALCLCSESAEHLIEEIRQICVSTLFPSLTGFRIIKNTTRDAGPARKSTSVDCPQYFLWGPGAARLTKGSSSLELSIPFMSLMAPHSIAGFIIMPATLGFFNKMIYASRQSHIHNRHSVALRAHSVFHTDAKDSLK